MVGEKTKLNRSYLQYELDLVIDAGLPIIVVNLNGNRKVDRNRCPGKILGTLGIHVPFKEKIIVYAMKNWPDRHKQLKKEGVDEPRLYKEEVYSKLGL